MIRGSVLLQHEQILKDVITVTAMSTCSLWLEYMKLACDGTLNKELDKLSPELDQKEGMPGNDAETSKYTVWKITKQLFPALISNLQ